MTTSLPSRRALISALSVSGLGELASKIAVLATTIAAANLVDRDGFAVYVGLLAVSIIAAALWDAGISTLVSVQGSRNAPLHALVGRVARARFFTAPVAIAALALGFIVFGQITTVEPVLVLLVAGSALLAGTSIPLQAWLRSRLAFGRATGALVLGRWTTAGVTVGLVILNPNVSLAGLFGAQAAGEFVTLLVAMLAVTRMPAPSDRGWNPNVIGLRSALPFAANTVLGIAYNRLDIVLVAVLTTAAQVAAYAPASRLQDAGYLLPTAVSVVALPQLSRMVARGDLPAAAAFVRTLWRYALAIAIPVAVMLIWWMPWIISTLLSAEYASAVPAARILVPSMVVASVGSAVLALLVAAGRGWATTRAFAVAFGVSVTLHLLLDSRLGAEGAAIASVTRDVANLATAAWLARDLLWPRLNSLPAILASSDEDEASIETRASLSG